MNPNKPTYEELENKVKSLELELTRLKQNVPRKDYEDFIQKRKEAELALQESEERFKNYINSTSDIVFTLDTEQKHTGVFGDWVEKAGLTKSHFIGKSTKELLGENAEIHVQANEKALSGEHVVYEWSAILGNSILYYQTSLSPLIEGNKVIGIIGVGRNITELKSSLTQWELR